MDRDPRFAELDRLIADEELYRPKGPPLPAEPDSDAPSAPEPASAG